MRSWLLACLAVPLVSLVSCSQADDSTQLARRLQPVVGGVSDDDASAHESVVLLRIDLGGSGFEVCTGALIAPDVVLTARHCVSATSSQVGCDSNGDPIGGQQISSDHAASSIHVFTGAKPSFESSSWVATGTKLYLPNSTSLCNNDIALVRLDQAVAGATPMQIRLNFGAQIGELTTAIGYGMTGSGNSGSVGTRRRRESISVISSGRDWNFLTAEGELVLGQAVCQGDSGGPLLAQDSQAIVGVASRVGSCETGPDIYTRVDQFAGLILLALSDGGEGAQLEGKPMPSQPVLKSNGASCTVGAECEGDLCAGPSGSQFCSQECDHTHPCSPDTICVRGAAVISGQAFDSVAACRPLASSDTCEGCRDTNCRQAVEGCAGDDGCAAVQSCVDACKDGDCVTGCAQSYQAYPVSVALFAELRACTCGIGCQERCWTMCQGAMPGDGGVSWEGGSGGHSQLDAQADTDPSQGAAGEMDWPAATNSTKDSGACSLSATGGGGLGALWLVGAASLCALRRSRGNKGVVERAGR